MNKNWLQVFRIREVLPGASTLFIAALDTGVFIPLSRLILLAAGFIGIYFSAFLINELVDSFDTDLHNPERSKGIIKHGVSRQFTLVSFLITAILGIAILAGQGLIWIALVGFLILFAYSAPIIRLKQWPFLELAAVTVGCALLPYVAYYQLAGIPFTWHEWLVMAFFSLGFPAIQLVNEGADIDADRQAGIHTTAVILGERNNLILIEILAFLSAILGFVTMFITLHWWYMYIVTLIFFLFTAAQFGLTIYHNRARLHELLRTGEHFGVFASDLGAIIMVIIFTVYYFAGFIYK
ncbi:prenyltransferase [Patescibacteria group bacterium]|nr:prenyltransferase [Patescibacteria group bacterium]